MEGFPDSKPGSKGQKVFPATWKYEIELYIRKNCSSSSERTSENSGRRIKEASTARS